MLISAMLRGVRVIATGRPRSSARQWILHVLPRRVPLIPFPYSPFLSLLAGGFIRPAQHRHAGQLGAVVADDHRRTCPLRDRPVELSLHARSRDRGVGDEPDTLAGGGVHRREDPEPPATGERIRQEVERPELAAPLRDHHRRACAQRPLAATAATQRQPLLTIQA